MNKKLWDVKFFFSNFLLPMIVLAIYCVAYALLSSRLLPNGVNFVFVSRLWKLVLLLSAVICLAYFVIMKLKKVKTGKIEFKYSVQKFSVSDLFLLLLPLTPVVQYILNNQDILSAMDSIAVFIFFAVFSAIFIFIIPMFLGNADSTRTMMLLGLAFVFTINSMSLLSQYFSWFEKGSLKIQLLFFGAVFLVIWFLYTRKLKGILYILLAVIFVSNSTIQYLSKVVNVDPSTQRMSENKLLISIEKKKPAVTPNIYLLVYDAYVPNETMLAHGIDNSTQEKYLGEQGFTLYPHTYSVGAKTVESMSRVLNASTRYYGNSRRAVSGDGIVQKILSNLGYKTYGIFPSDYMFLGIGSSYDYSVPERSTPPYIHLISAILLGEFRFDLKFSDLPHDQYSETKKSIFESVSGKQVFVYMHTDMPSHSRISGICAPDEAEQYKERVKLANIEMKKDLQTIIANDPEAIVIVASDHGPFITKNCRSTGNNFDISEITRLDIQDRFGTFLAIKWPTEDFTKFDEITVLQDIFPAVFAYMYGDDSILQSKLEPDTLNQSAVSGASIKNGIIYGGKNEGESLFLSDN